MRFGPYPYATPFIDQIAENRPGVYVLGRRDAKDPLTFHPKYVGRSDTCVRAELKNYLDRGYDVFWFEFARTPVLAFLGECFLYHQHQKGGIDNKMHPDLPNAEHIPAGMEPKCWVCGHPVTAKKEPAPDASKG